MLVGSINGGNILSLFGMTTIITSYNTNIISRNGKLYVMPGDALRIKKRKPENYTYKVETAQKILLHKVEKRIIH